MTNTTNTTGGGSAARSLVIENLDKSYVRGKPVLQGVNLEISGRTTTAIIGPSGTGKSTLIRCINRLVAPTRGKIHVSGIEITALSGRALRMARRRIGMVFQEFNLVERLTVIENVLCGRLGTIPVWRAWLRRYPAEDIDLAFDILETVGLKEFATERADSLSGGQRQRVGIARAVMQQPDLLLADEPTSSLDPKTSAEIMELLADVAARGKLPILINIHDVSLAKRFADRVIGMSQGRIIFDDAPAALTPQILGAIYGGEVHIQ